MPLPAEQRVKFFVFVIESPSAVDLYHRRGEGEAIRQVVELNGIQCVVKTAICLQAFDACLKFGISAAMKERPGLLPLLHISAHGNAEGVQLSDGHILAWKDLRTYLYPVNEALNNFLVVCMSSCEGYAGIRMAMHLEDKTYPYFALVGCSAKPTWGETAIGYATFYHQLWRGEHISSAVNAMRVASGNDSFFLEHATQSRQAYLDHIRATDTASLQANLQQIAERAPVNTLAELAKLGLPPSNLETA